MRIQPLTSDTPCSECGFELWHPIAITDNIKLGLYNDGRFPGRCILSFREHVEKFEDLSQSQLLIFTRSIQKVIKTITKVTKPDRVNVAILGNAEPHLHAHLIPRYSDYEEFPKKSPWNNSQEPIEGLPGMIQPLKEQILETLIKNESRH